MFSLILIASAFSQTMFLEPQNRLTIGTSWSDGNTGLAVSFDSRLTQLVSANIGAFNSISKKTYSIDDEDLESWISLEKAIWMAPGIRWPHRYQSESINWDIFLRAGFGCVFSGNAFDKDWFLVEPSALIGGDFLLKKDRYGLRVSTKAFHYRVDVPSVQETFFTIRPQIGLEVFYQW
jgi:hypothetical protein